MTCDLLAASLKSIVAATPGTLAEGLVWGILTVAVFISFRVLRVADMSVEGTFALGGTITAALAANGVPIWLAMLAAMAAGGICGGVTGLMHTKLGIPAILAGILTMFALYSVNIHVLGNKSSLALLGVPTLTNMLSDGLGLKPQIAGLIAAVAFAVVVAAVVTWFFSTKLGYAIRSTGGNEKMARAQGVNTDSCKLIALAASNALAATAGSLLAQINNGANVNMGGGAIVIGLAGVVLGETVTLNLLPFGFRTAAAVIGSVLYRTIISFVLQLVTFLTTDDVKLISAVIIAAVLAVGKLKTGAHKRMRRTRQCSDSIT